MRLFGLEYRVKYIASIVISIVAMVTIATIGLQHRNTVSRVMDTTPVITVQECDHILIGFDSLSDRSVLCGLFRTDLYDAERKEVTWMPGVEDGVKFPISDDGLVRTTIDTMLNWQSMVVVITKSKGYSIVNGKPFREGLDCHACAVMLSAALFKRVDKRWMLVNFEKTLSYEGGYGDEKGAFRIEAFRYKGYQEDDYSMDCLIYRSEVDGNQGISEGHETYYVLSPIAGLSCFATVFRYRYLSKNMSGYGGEYTMYGEADNLNRSKDQSITVHYRMLRAGKETYLKKTFSYDKERLWFMDKRHDDFWTLNQQ